LLAAETEEATGRRFDPDTELIFTTGGSEAVSLCGLALLGPGDEAIIPQPAWHHYWAVVEMAGATPVALPLDVNDGYRLDPERLARAITPRTRLLVLNTPGNPSGAVQSAEDLEAIAQLADKHGFYVLCDEVYKDFVFEGAHVSIARFMVGSDRLIYLNSLSKSDAMTGWRVGWAAAAAPVSDALNRVHQYLPVCGVPFAQHGALAALAHPGRRDYLNAMGAAFARRREIWIQAFKDCPGVTLQPPKGAFYLFPRIGFQGLAGLAFARHMLETQGLAMVPWDVFGSSYRHHVRISYGMGEETQQRAADRFKEAMGG